WQTPQQSHQTFGQPSRCCLASGSTVAQPKSVCPRCVLPSPQSSYRWPLRPSRRPPTNWLGYSTACSSTVLATSIKERSPMKYVTVTAFCVTSSGGRPNSASNSLRFIQTLPNSCLLNSSEAGVTWEQAKLLMSRFP